MSQDINNHEDYNEQENNSFEQNDIDQEREEVLKAVQEDAIKNPQPNFLIAIFTGIVDEIKVRYERKKARIEENDELLSERDEVYGDGKLETAEEKKEKLNKSIKKRLLFVLGAIPIIFFIVNVLILAKNNYDEAVRKQAQQAKENQLKWKQDVSFGDDVADAWKVHQSVRIKNLEDELTRTRHDVNTSVTSGVQQFKQIAEGIKENTNKQFQAIETRIQSLETNTNQRLDDIPNLIESRVAKTEENIEILKNTTSATRKNKSERLPTLEELSDAAYQTFATNTTKKNTDSAQGGENTISETANVPEFVDMEIVSSVSIVETQISTLERFEEDNITKTEETLEFTMQAGFAKGTIVNGVTTQTLQYGKSQPEPIFISLDSTVAMANSFLGDARDCLLMGTVSGDFGSSRAKIRLSKISCSMQNNNDEMEYIDAPIDGWIFGEDGQNGLKGRLITKEGDIISKAIPLGLLEGAIATLSASPVLLTDGNTGTSTTALSAANPNDVVSMQAAQGFTSGGTKVVEKIAEYYVKLLDSLNPMVEIKAGRTVTIAFKGGEKIKTSKYRPINVNYYDGEDDNGEGEW